MSREATKQRRFLHEDLGAKRWIAPWLRYQQAMRYRWAATLVANSRVLEVGCGSGGGARELSQSAAHVIGIDVDAQAIAVAKTWPHSSKLEFIHHQPGRLPFPDSSFDWIVTFETIEHVIDDQEFLAEIQRVVRPGGQSILSTPNRTITNPGLSLNDQPLNPLHVREYSTAELNELLNRFFGEVTPWGQTFYSPRTLGLLSACARVSPRLGARVRQIWRLACMCTDTAARHYPKPNMGNYLPEVQIVVARLPREK